MKLMGKLVMLRYGAGHAIAGFVVFVNKIHHVSFHKLTFLAYITRHNLDFLTVLALGKKKL